LLCHEIINSLLKQQNIRPSTSEQQTSFIDNQETHQQA